MARTCNESEVVEERNPLIQTIENIALAALSSVETCRSTYAVCRQALEEGIPGDFVECGVYAGSHAAIMAKTLIDDPFEGHEVTNSKKPFDRCITRRVHLFDSFEGIPEPTEQDKEYLASGHRAGTAACSLEGVKANMKQWGIPEELLVYHPGWFDRTIFNPLPHPWIGPHGIEDIAVLRLDADLYESTMICMEGLYPLLSLGGFLIVDDYGLTGARQAVNDYMLNKAGGFGPVYFRK